MLFLWKLGTILLTMSSLQQQQQYQQEETKLLNLLQPVFSSLTCVELLGDPIVQASAVGYKCRLLSSADNVPERVFVKHVDAATYAATKKDWHDLRRALVYVRTEVRFYKSLQLPCMPMVEYAEYNLKGLIPEDDHVTDAGERAEMPTVEECRDKGGLLVLDLIDDTDYYQASPLTMDQCKQCLTAIAALHKAGWENVPLLKKAARDLSIPTFSLSLRNPKELANIEASWKNFRGAFESQLKDAGLWERTATLATRLKQNAHYISQQLSPSPTDSFATLVHGDYKAMNAFLPRSLDQKAILCDFASAGIGNVMMDVAMHISHAVLPDDLSAIQSNSDNTGEMELLDHYLDALDVEEYPRDTALLHYKLALVDYLRFFMGRMWASATPETMQSKRNNPNINNINRYPQAAMAFLDRGERYLTEIEAMRERKARGDM